MYLVRMPGMSQNVCLSQKKRWELWGRNPVNPLKKAAVNSFEGCMAELFVAFTLPCAKNLVTLYR